MAHSFSNPFLVTSGYTLDPIILPGLLAAGGIITPQTAALMAIGTAAVTPNVPEPPTLPEMEDLEPTGLEVMGTMQEQAKKRAGMRGPGDMALGAHEMSPGSVFQSTLLGG